MSSTNYPIVLNQDWTAENNKAAKEVLDFAINEFESRSKYREREKKMYDSFNGISNQNLIKNLTSSYGKDSKTKFIRYHIGRARLKTLINEFLRINIKPSAFATNRDAVQKKTDKYFKLRARSLAKDMIQEAQNQGFDVYKGVKIPDKDDENFWIEENFKTDNELLMQKIINSKVKTQKLKNKYAKCFIDGVITSKFFAKVEKNEKGANDLRHINPINMICIDSEDDMFYQNTPYIGEKRYLYQNQLMRMYPQLTKKDFEDLSDNNEDMYKPKSLYNGGVPGMAYPTYTLEWHTYRDKKVIYERMKDGSEKVYDISEDRYKKDEKKINKKKELGVLQEKTVREHIIWEGTRIGANKYVQIRPIPEAPGRRNDNNHFYQMFNYIGLVFGMVNGEIISLQEMITDLENVYDIIRWQINRELRKFRGDTIILNKAYYPKEKSFSSLMYDLMEEGVVEINSSSEQNQGEYDGDKDFAKDFKSSGNQILGQLFEAAIDIENTIERITSITPARQGLEKATTTATTASNNLEASRTSTYDLFYYITEFINESLMVLANKTKVNFQYLENWNNFEFSDQEMKFLHATEELSFDDYGIVINDGRKDEEIKNKMESLFQFDINAGSLRTYDVGRFYMQDSLAEGMRVIENGFKAIQEIKKQQQQSEQEFEQQQQESVRQQESELDAREDQQEQNMEILRSDLKKEQIELEKYLSSLIESDKTNSNEKIQQSKDRESYNREIAKAKLTAKNKQNEKKN